MLPAPVCEQEREQSSDGENPDMGLSSQEILDEITTHRGELKLRSVNFPEQQFPVSHAFPSFAICIKLT